MTDTMFTRTALTEAAEKAGVTIDQARSEGLLYPTDRMLEMLRLGGRGAWTVIPS